MTFTNIVDELGTKVDMLVERDEFPWKKVLQADPCAYCGEPGGTIDHIEAVHRGTRRSPKDVRHRAPGALSTVQNGTGSCVKHNAQKGSAKLLSFLLIISHKPRSSRGRHRQRLREEQAHREKIRRREEARDANTFKKKLLTPSQIEWLREYYETKGGL